MSDNRSGAPNEQKGFERSLSLRGARRSASRRQILASHLVFTGYGHWLPNDLRGSGSVVVRKEAIAKLGKILPGRQYPQPPRQAVKAFVGRAEKQLAHPRMWFNGLQRSAIAEAFGAAAARQGYTLWACAVCSNHAHIVVRTHSDRSEAIWFNLAGEARGALIARELLSVDHPLWSHRGYKVFLQTPQDVLGPIRYVNENPTKERLPVQRWSFIRACPFR